MSIRVDYQKEIEETKFKRDFLKSLLKVAAGEQQRIPAEYQYVLGEIVWGTVDYLGGKGGGFGFKNHIESGPLHTGLWKILDGHLEILRWKVDEKTFKALRELVEPHTHYAPPDRPYSSCELHDCYDSAEGIVGIWTHSIIPIPNFKITTDFDDSQKRDIAGIGDAMKPYLKADLEHIAKNYAW